MYNKGSEWRKWDLHVHTASSYDAKYKGIDSDELLVKAWKYHQYSAVAITDHFIIDIDRIKNLRSLANDITIFPGFEMRTDKGAPNLHVIAIFSDTCNLLELKNDFDAIMIRDLKKDGETNETIVRDLSDINKFVKRHKGILTIHAGKKTNGVDEQITNALDVAQAIKKDISTSIDIFEIGNISDISDYREMVFKYIPEKPLILCSDNHDPRDYSIKEYLWIKANPTFQGLVQTLMQPRERVFVGPLPEKLDKIAKNKSAYIKSITVKRVSSPKNISENWFDVSLELNPALVAIIGNKGSGKSAFSDIIGHLCKANNMDAASFLNLDRFRKPPENKASDYLAEIKWCDEKVEKVKSLCELDRQSTIIEAQYLPQKFIEKVCNDLSSEFQSEIDQVIFSYVDSTEKGDAKNLRELIENKSKSIQIRIMDIKNQINICNREIVRLEDRKTEVYKTTLQANLEKRKDDLKRHELNKPIEVKRPEKSQNAEYEKDLEEIKTLIEQLEHEEKKARDTLRNINIRIEKSKVILDDVAFLSEKIDEIKAQISEYKITYGLSANEFELKVLLPIEELKNDLATINEERVSYRKLLGIEESDSITSISSKLKLANHKMTTLITHADAAEKSYQKYIKDLRAWDNVRKEIIGDINTEDTIEYYKNELKYIINSLDTDYDNKQKERNTLVFELFKQKKLVSDLYTSIYQPIEKELIPLLENSDEKIEFNINLVLKDQGFGAQLLLNINQRISGVFKGKTEAANKMKEFIKSTDFNNFDSLLSFMRKVLACIYEDYDISSQKVKDKLAFYNLLTSLDYIDAEYNLTLGGNQLSMLSPGERGIVLLVFYLALSKKDIPLIIDQPEDNLDNQSVFSRLVPCIKEAKKKRQVIIVTHNPNIAIACDAEQIISCSINKSSKRITYIAGSIEDKTIRDSVIDILEGTMPAFELRKMKYTYELYENP